MIDAAKYRKVPIAEITQPKLGKICYGGSWWQVTENDEVLFYKTSPQCNINKAIVERVAKNSPLCKEVRWIEMAYLPHNCHDYL